MCKQLEVRCNCFGREGNKNGSIVFTLSVEMFCNIREKKRERERDELWKRLTELEVERRNAIIASPNTPVPATTTATTRARP